jgi:hypothetical protein
MQHGVALAGIATGVMGVDVVESFPPSWSGVRLAALRFPMAKTARKSRRESNSRAKKDFPAQKLGSSAQRGREVCFPTNHSKICVKPVCRSEGVPWHPGQPRVSEQRSGREGGYLWAGRVPTRAGFNCTGGYSSLTSTPGTPARPGSLKQPDNSLSYWTA